MKAVFASLVVGEGEVRNEKSGRMNCRFEKFE